MRFDDFGAVMTSGPRIGQRVLQTVWDRIRPGGANAVNAVDFQQTRKDISYCAPSRCSIMTGLYRHNHGVNNTTVGTYYTNCRRGTRNAQLYSGTNQWEGPWEFDLAAKAGLASTPVAAASQPYVGQTSSVRNGYSTTTGTYTGTIGRGDGAVGVAGDDDLQAR
jgi:hypothetical protein